MCRVVVSKPEGKRPLVGCMHRCENNMNLYMLAFNLPSV
jgi:hypothetical protein